MKKEKVERSNVEEWAEALYRYVKHFNFIKRQKECHYRFQAGKLYNQVYTSEVLILLQ